MRILQELCSIPTAPFVEWRVAAYIEQFARQRPGLRLSRDPFGNLLLEMPGRERLPRWVFTAHMDHPGFVARRMIGADRLEANFRGGVRAEFFNGSKVRFFTVNDEIGGTVESHLAPKGKQPYPSRAVVRVPRPVPPGTPGMWDQGTGRSRGKKFFSCVCDDLAGAAAALRMIDDLHDRPAKVPVAVLLTRAEEEGFIGAIAASRTPTLLRKTDRVIAIECSAMQPYAPQGAGVIIRIGDRTSVFNSSLSFFIAQEAASLARLDKRFKYQRALMPGGTCEATVYDVYGFTAASICIALGNYHNMDVKKKRIAPEYIDVSDWENMAALFLRIARHAHDYKPGHAALRARLETRYRKLQALLKPDQTPARPRDGSGRSA